MPSVPQTQPVNQQPYWRPGSAATNVLWSRHFQRCCWWCWATGRSVWSWTPPGLTTPTTCGWPPWPTSSCCRWDLWPLDSPGGHGDDGCQLVVMVMMVANWRSWWWWSPTGGHGDVGRHQVTMVMMVTTCWLWWWQLSSGIHRDDDSHLLS